VVAGPRNHPNEGLAAAASANPYAARHVPGDRHRDALGHPGPDHVPGSSPPQIVEELVGNPGDLAGSRPGPAEISHGFTISMEHQRGNSDIASLLEQPGLPAAVKVGAVPPLWLSA
jgi:hypothetical protein